MSWPARISPPPGASHQLVTVSFVAARHRGWPLTITKAIRRLLTANPLPAGGEVFSGVGTQMVSTGCQFESVTATWAERI